MFKIYGISLEKKLVKERKYEEIQKEKKQGRRFGIFVGFDFGLFAFFKL